MDKIECRICHREFKQITATHLKKEHHMTLAEYKEAFPDAPMFSQALLTQKKYQASRIFRKPKPEEKKEKEDMQVEALNTDISGYIDEDVIYDEEGPSKFSVSFDDEITEDIYPSREEIEKMVQEEDERLFLEDLEIFPLGTKDEIFHCLRSLFPNIQKDYMIEKRRYDRSVEYRFITDFVDLENKINFEFVNSFWHNADYFIDPNRDRKLAEDGWEVINFEELAVTRDDIMSKVSHCF